MMKNAIWAIVGLMGAALLGIILLQTYWINKAIELKGDEFNADVNIALKQVAQKLQELDIEERSRMASKGLLTVGEKINLDPKSKFKTSSLSELQPVQEDPSGAKEKAKVFQNYRDLNSWKPKSLEERIKLDDLNTLLSTELKNRGIDIDYDYEVYSTFKGVKNQLIIRNGTWGIPATETSQVTQLAAEIDELSKSEYKVALFEEDASSRGELVVAFPKKSSVVWRAVLLPLIAAILFTAIVLFCFIYTVQVIFAQKKLAEMKTDFINNMTHEFKTPIATISLAADSITSPMILGKQDKVKRFAGIIKQENKRMLSQVEKVLQMALLDKQDFKLNLDFIDLHEIIGQAVMHSHLQAEKDGGAVTADLQATKYRIEGDLTHVSNIIHNLLDNANKYSPENPKISVHTRNVANGVEVIVKDNGIGLSKEARKHIFDKFYRVHTGNVHDVKGFGLGLSYVKAMVVAHKGQIDVKSELGKGSSFILFFPFHIRSNTEM